MRKIYKGVDCIWARLCWGEGASHIHTSFIPIFVCVLGRHLADVEPAGERLEEVQVGCQEAVPAGTYILHNTLKDS